MKERKTSVMTSRKQIVVVSCLMLILVTSLTGVYIAEKSKQQKQAELAKSEEKEMSAQIEQEQELQEVDAIILPKQEEEVDILTETPQIMPQETYTENNDMDISEEIETEDVEEEASKAVGGSAVIMESAQADPVLRFSGELLWPVEGSVLMNYSMDQSIYFATLDQYKYNPAMIISASAGTDVASAAAGNIVEIREDSQTGCTVVVDIGDGYQLTYGQMGNLNYKEGAHVEAGDVIGVVAPATKYYSIEGDNLYFAMTKEGIAADPTEFLPQ